MDEDIQKTTAEMFELVYFKRIPVSGNDLHIQSLILEKPDL